MPKLQLTFPPEVSRSPNKTMGRSFWVYKKHKDMCQQAYLDWEYERSSAKDLSTQLLAWYDHIRTTGPKVHLHIDCYGCRPKDADNAVAGCKAIIDVLRKEGLLVDDNPTKMSLSVECHKVSHKPEEKVVITLSY